MLLVAAALLAMPFAFALAEEQPGASASDDLVRLRKELTQVQSERQKNRVERDAEAKEYQAYQRRTAGRMAQVRSETDSINSETATSQRTGDSLSALVKAFADKKEQVELSKDNLRQRLARSCDALDSTASSFPPLVCGRLRSSLALVKSELAARTMEGAEAFARLFQVVSLARDAASSIEATQENSPVADLRGQVSRLRIGTLFEAMADQKAEKCLVWRSNSTQSEALWQLCADPSAPENIVKAVAIREGKALPSFVVLPLAAPAKGGRQ
jgi:septal ring factor EnvC (AmiA/AmiB activator)